VLVSPENGQGPPPWTTNSYAVTPWLESLRRLEALDARVVVPGQGPAMHDKAYLRRTIELFVRARRESGPRRSSCSCMARRARASRKASRVNEERLLPSTSVEPCFAYPKQAQVEGLDVLKLLLPYGPRAKGVTSS
jgi:glyoxylase-like metal-dependent hydrolase (beta-lactamase superfamily II)